jgi:hypothetical protein
MEPTPDEALLTAYLDGELTPQDRQRLEQRLADDPELRQRLTVLEETWHYLDLLEQDGIDVEKIETTLKIAAISVSNISFVPPNVSRWLTWGLALLVGTALFAVPFQIGKRSALDDPSFRRQIERLDMYLDITNDDEGLKLLRYLAVQRVFLPPLPQDVPPIDPSGYEPSRHIGLTLAAFSNSVIGSWDDFDDAALYPVFYKNLQKYNTILSPEKKEQIRKLHRDIESAPQQMELLLTLQNFYHWRNSLQSYEKIALRQPKPLEEKAADIIDLKTRLDRLLPEDAIVMPSEIVGIEESKRLADTLTNMPLEQQVWLLNEEPILIINDLKQRSYH